MKKILLSMILIGLCVVATGCYYGKSDSWEIGYMNAEEKKGSGKFLLSYTEDRDVTFDELEISLDGKTITTKIDYNEFEFSVKTACEACDKEEKVNLDINWVVDGKEYSDQITLEKE